MSYFIYNGVNSLDMGLRIQRKNVFSSPKRDINFKSINGRNGDLILSNNRYENVDVSYTVFIVAKTISELADKLTAIKQWLYSSSDSYARLEDSYDTKFFRKAVFHKALDIEDELNKIGVFTINFNCMPFRYDKAGFEEIITEDYSQTVINPYIFPSLPYIKISGNGNIRLTIQSPNIVTTWLFTDVDEYIEIDGEQMNFFKGNESRNDIVEGDGFPELIKGSSRLYTTKSVTEIKIIPRWCCL